MEKTSLKERRISALKDSIAIFEEVLNEKQYVLSNMSIKEAKYYAIKRLVNKEKLSKSSFVHNCPLCHEFFIHGCLDCPWPETNNFTGDGVACESIGSPYKNLVLNVSKNNVIIVVSFLKDLLIKELSSICNTNTLESINETKTPKFSIGDRVKLVRGGIYKDYEIDCGCSWNPLWSEKYIIGTVYRIHDSDDFDVKWDNRITARYNSYFLELVTLEDYNKIIVPGKKFKWKDNTFLIVRDGNMKHNGEGINISIVNLSKNHMLVNSKYIQTEFNRNNLKKVCYIETTPAYISNLYLNDIVFID